MRNSFSSLDKKIIEEYSFYEIRYYIGYNLEKPGILYSCNWAAGKTPGFKSSDITYLSFFFEEVKSIGPLKLIEDYYIDLTTSLEVIVDKDVYKDFVLFTKILARERYINDIKLVEEIMRIRDSYFLEEFQKKILLMIIKYLHPI